MNVRKVIGVMLLSFGLMASVSASCTDDLKQKYADGSFYIEYQVTRQEKNGELANRQKPSMFSPMQSYDKYIYAQKGANKYYQRNDFANEKGRFLHTSYYRKLRNEYLNNYYNSAISSVQMNPLGYGILYNTLSNMAEITNEDINVVRDGKIYALDRYNASGYWTTAEKINEKPRLAQIMCANMIVPTIFNSILLPVDNTGLINFVSTETKHTMGEDLLCETYTFQKTNEYGSPIGELWYFQFFYQDGQLKYFSDALSQRYYNRSKDKHFELLNNVRELKSLNDDSIFNVIDDYAIEEFEVE